MHISALEEYGLRCALQLAYLPVGQVLSASAIAEKEGISNQYASKIMHLFKKAGLVQATRGIQGGFFLSNGPETITLKTLFASLHEEKEADASFCGQYKGQQEQCVHLTSCSIRPVWNVLSSYFDTVLDRINLNDLARSEVDAGKLIFKQAQMEADRIQNFYTGKPTCACSTKTEMAFK